MRTRAAVLREMGAPAPYAESRPIEIVELELDPPGPGEVLIKVGAAEAAADGWFVHVFVDAAGREPVPIPESIRSSLERLQLGAGEAA